MRKPLVLIMVVLLCFPMLQFVHLISPSSQSPTNTIDVSNSVVQNGGFEQGLTGWTTVGDGFLAVSGDNQHSGNYSLEISSSISQQASFYQYVNLPNTSYEFSFWLYRVDPKSWMACYLSREWDGNTGKTVSSLMIQDNTIELNAWDNPYAPGRQVFNNDVTIGSWHNMMFLANATLGTQDFYIDGNLIANLNSSSGNVFSPNVLVFGDVSTAACNGTSYFDDIALNALGTETTAGSSNGTFDNSYQLAAAGARYTALNGNNCLYVDFYDNLVAHPNPYTANPLGVWQAGRALMSKSLEDYGFNVTFAADIPTNLTMFDVVFIEAHYACEPSNKDLIKNFVAQGGGLVLMFGTPAYFSNYCKDGWPGGNLTSIKDWFGASVYANSGGRATLVVDQPFGTQLHTGDAVYSAAEFSLSAVESLQPDAQVIATWENGAVFAFTHIYGNGRIFYEGDYMFARPLKASFTWSPTFPEVDESVIFDASSCEPAWNGSNSSNITEYGWSFGDGNTTSTGDQIIVHSYNSSGSFNVTLAIYDNIGSNASFSAIVQVGPGIPNGTQNQAIVRIAPQDTIIARGVTFSIGVLLENVPADPGVAGVQFTVSWNPTVLVALNMTEVMFHNSTPTSEWDNIWTLQNKINNTAGYASYAVLWQDIYEAQNEGYCPIFGNHTLATLTFQAIANGSTTLRLSRTNIGEPNARPLPHVTIDGSVNVTLFMSADINQDGIVDVYDCTLLAQHFGTNANCISWDPRVDLNCDGVVDIFDAIIMVQCWGQTK